jgi:hypothetical protein
MPEDLTLPELERELQRMEEELYIPEEIAFPEAKRKLPRVRIGKDTYYYDKEAGTIRKIGTKEVKKLTPQEKSNLDWYIDTAKKLHEELIKVGRIRRGIATRVERAFVTEQKARARPKLETVI